MNEVEFENYIKGIEAKTGQRMNDQTRAMIKGSMSNAPLAEERPMDAFDSYANAKQISVPVDELVAMRREMGQGQGRQDGTGQGKGKGQMTQLTDDDYLRSLNIDSMDRFNELAGRGAFSLKNAAVASLRDALGKEVMSPNRQTPDSTPESPKSIMGPNGNPMGSSNRHMGRNRQPKVSVAEMFKQMGYGDQEDVLPMAEVMMDQFGA